MDLDSQANPEKARVEQLLRDAHIHRMRQQWAAAETLCRKALELDPDEAMGREMLGDLLMGKGDTAGALSAYRGALEKQPGKASLEDKIARAVLAQGEDEREKAEALLLLESPLKKNEAKRNATLATLLSLFCPGLGQLFVFRQYVKGGILAAVGLLALTFGISEMLKVFAVVAGAGRALDTKPNDVLAVLGLLGILVWIYSLLDAAGGGGKGKKRASDV